MGGDIRKRRRSRSRSVERRGRSSRHRSSSRNHSRHDSRSRSRSVGRGSHRSRSKSPQHDVEMKEEEFDQEEAERIAKIAQLAEERAAKRAAERQQAAQTQQLTSESTTTSTTDSNIIVVEKQDHTSNGIVDKSANLKNFPTKLNNTTAATATPATIQVAFRSKAQREKDAIAKLEQKRLEAQRKRQEAEKARQEFLAKQQQQQQEEQEAKRSRGRGERDYSKSNNSKKEKKSEENKTTLSTSMEEQALQAIKDQYLGKKVNKKKIIKASEKFTKNFQFDWEASEDTSKDLNPLYSQKLDVNLLYGRGYRAGLDMREQRKQNSFLTELAQKRQKELFKADQLNANLTKEQVEKRQKAREREMYRMQQREHVLMQELAAKEAETIGQHWSDKALEEMKERDWRIFREDFDITIKGGKAPNPLRKWTEAALPEAVFRAIGDMGFERPSPIQMQAIPIGLERRDIIGIAETGSGKTAAFTIPMIAYIYSLPPTMIDRTGEQGPLALVMAPTRELALQIEQEAIKLCKYTSVGIEGKKNTIKTLTVVGGQSIEDQAFKLRQGIDILIGTPGRLMDCIESHYLVLNQCNYVVLDEADRMIDMGFEPQVVAVLENMGSLLKSENEEEMEQQLSLSSRGVELRLRVTTMFSATMPVEVERLAKTFLRHPAIVKIGDEDSGKNKRIDQRVLYMNTGKKKNKLLESLREILDIKAPKSRKEKSIDGKKVIVFVNIKKECDHVSKTISSEGFRATTLHGGKSQDQREESLQGFREGYCDVLVATDVAGRGLDIPDVTHVINYDLPAKIQNYCHRIGRTGRAGKEGVAISFLTDQDEEIMYDLKQYLISTNMPVPPELANHPAAKVAPGTRDEKGNIIGKSRRETTIFTK